MFHAPFLGPPYWTWEPPPAWMDAADAAARKPPDFDGLDSELDPPLPDILEKARELGIAADTVKHPPCQDLDLSWAGRAEHYDRIKSRPTDESLFRAEMHLMKLEIEDDAKHLVRQMFNDEANPGEPDWKTILPPTRPSTALEGEPQRLTYQGELTAKTILTARLAGQEFAASIPPEDSPFEIETLKITPAMQKMANDYMQAQASEKLDCHKESLAFLPDSTAATLSDQELDGVYDDALPKVKANPINSDATLSPEDQSSAGTANDTTLPQSKRKHVESPLRKSESAVQRSPFARSVSGAPVPTRAPRVRFPTTGSSAKKPKKAKSLPGGLPAGEMMDLDHPMPDFAGDELGSKNGDTSSIPSSKAASIISPGRGPHTPPFIIGTTLWPAIGESPFDAPPFRKPELASKNGDTPSVAGSKAASMISPGRGPSTPSMPIDTSDWSVISQFLLDSSPVRKPDSPLGVELEGSILNTPQAQLNAIRNSSTNNKIAKWLTSLTRFIDTRSMSRNEKLLAGLPPDPKTPRSTPSKRLPSADVDKFDAVSPSHWATGSPFPWDSPYVSPVHSVPVADLVFFLSTALLKTHLPLVRYMEGLSAPPKLVFRDYATIVHPPRAGAAVPKQPSTGTSDPESQLPEEADIIISPNAGIMLTTSHALTQRYLPGHAPPDSPFPDQSQFHGPVLTRMMKLSIRYEYFYILVYHPVPPSGTTRYKVDPIVREAITSLEGFCSYLSAQSLLVPLFVLPDPKQVAKLIFTLARKHLSLLPSIGLSITEHETRWEWFLRAVGFNPHAARLVLGILEARERRAAGDGPVRPALYGLLEMDAERLFDEFHKYVGREVIGHVTFVLDVASR